MQKDNFAVSVQGDYFQRAYVRWGAKSPPCLVDVLPGGFVRATCVHTGVSVVGKYNLASRIAAQYLAADLWSKTHSL